MRPMLDAVARLAPDFAKKDCLEVLWATSQLGVRGPFVRPLVDAIARLAPQLSALDAAQCFLHLASLGVTSEAAATAKLLAGGALARALPSLSVKAAAGVLWGGGALGLRDADLAQQLVAEVAPRALALPPGDLAKALWGAVKMGLNGIGLGEGGALLLAAAVKAAPSFSPRSQEAACALWACVSLGIVRDAAAARLLVASAATAAPALTPQSAVDSYWAAVTLGVREGGFLAPLELAATRAAPQFTPQQAGNALWAAATLSSSLGPRSGAVVGPLAAAAIRLAPAFIPQAAPHLLWAAGALSVRHEGLLKHLVEGAARTAHACAPGAAVGALSAAAALGASPSAAARPIAEAVARAAQLLTPAQLSKAMIAIASLGLCEEAIAAPLADAACRAAPQFSREEAHSVLQAHFAGAPVASAGLAACWATFRKGAPPPPSISKAQAEVAAALRGMGWEVEVNAPILEGLRVLDLLATPPERGGVRARVAIFVDGVASFFPPQGEQPPFPRPTRLREGHLASAGIVSSARVAFWEWERAASEGARRALLQRRVGGFAR